VLLIIASISDEKCLTFKIGDFGDFAVFGCGAHFNSEVRRNG